MSILFYTTRNITSDLSAGLLVNLRILETRSNEIDFLTATKTNRSATHITSATGLSIRRSVNPWTDFYINECLESKDWQEVYDKIDVSSLKDYTELFIMGGLLHPSGDVYRYSRKLPDFLKSALGIRFLQIGKNVVNVLGILKAHREYGIPLHEFSYDTDELCCGLIAQTSAYHQYHIYDIPRYGMKRLDSLGYHFSMENVPIEPIDKEYDFTFGYTVFPNGNRPSYVQFVDDIAKEFENVNIYTVNKLTGVDTSIPRDNYLHKIQKSRFTLIIPSYDKTCFSMYRFIESIQNDCLPLIHPDCYISEVEESFGIRLDLLVNRIPEEDERLTLINYYKQKLLVPTRWFI